MANLAETQCSDEENNMEIEPQTTPAKIISRVEPRSPSDFAPTLALEPEDSPIRVNHKSKITQIENDDDEDLVFGMIFL